MTETQAFGGSSAAQWSEELRSAFPSAEISAFKGPPERWEYRGTSVSELSIHEVHAGRQRIRHRNDGTFGRTFSLIVQVEGRTLIHQRRGDVELGPGQFLIVSVDQLLGLEAADAYRQTFVLIPATLLGNVPQDALGSKSEQDHPLDRILVSNVETLALAASLLDEGQARHASRGLLSNLRLSTLFQGGTEDTSSSHRIRKAHDFIEEHIADPDLDPRRVADAQGVGRRHLDAIFQRTGTTLHRSILQRRIDKAAFLLTSTAWRDDTILAIALECGFSSHSHFSRVFRSHLGLTPTEWRRGTTSKPTSKSD